MIRRNHVLSILPFALLATTNTHAKDLEAFHAYAEAAPAPRSPSPGPWSGFVASVDDKRGTPTIYWAKRGKPLPQALVGANADQIARHHLVEQAALYGLTPQAIQSAQRVLVHDPGHGGTIVVFRQFLDGIEVLHSDMKVLIDARGQLVALAGALHPGATPGSAQAWGSFTLAPEAGVTKALADLYGAKVSVSLLNRVQGKQSGYDLFTLQGPFKEGTSEYHFVDPARVKKVFYALPNALVPAYYVEVQVSERTSTSRDGYAYVIAANDGRLLLRKNLTSYDAFNYRVWADSTAPHTPKDGPLADYTPHPTGIPDNSISGFVAPSLVSMEGFKANPPGMVDPWLPAGATVTQGNNVDAYTDHVPPDGFSGGTDYRAPITGPGTFDYTYDTALAPLANLNQSHAATTQLFYTTNWLHDYWYDSGFTEAAGNAQQDNFGRGGVAGDRLLAEAQDGAINPGLRNNSSMEVPADGASPRMQMYVWTNTQATFMVSAPLNATYAGGSASFGAQNFDTTGQLVLANDGVLEPPTPATPAGGKLTDACSPLPPTVAGKIVLTDRGYCTNVTKAVNVQNAGGIGMILANNTPFASPPLVGGTNPTLTIGSLTTTFETGNALKAALMQGSLTVHMMGATGTEHDGTIDNAIIAHEWGHYLHNRLVITGSNQSYAESEGWGDFISLHMSSRDGDDFATGTFACVQYATSLLFDEGYYGVRRLPYTRDMTKNPFTFKHISNNQTLPPIALGFGSAINAAVHNSGEIWASMMWDAYTALIMSGKYSFDQAKRKMADYVVGGMMMTPVNPTYTEQRDAILAYVASVDMADMTLMAGEFARRGAGSCAISPDRFSATHDGVVESYEVKGRQVISSVKVDDSVMSCDSDGILDGGETGKVAIEIANDGPAALSGTVVTVRTSNTGVIFPNGNQVTIPNVGAFQTSTVTIDIGLAPGQSASKRINVEVTATNENGCVTDVVKLDNDRLDVDDVASNSTMDLVDSEKSTWTAKGQPATGIWSRQKDVEGDHAWYGLDYGFTSDASLESADINVAMNGNFVVSFEHRYLFDGNRDGGVVEISSDGGQTWQDVSAYVNPGYGGTIVNQPSNPLAGRSGYINQNAAYPAMNAVALDFGNAFAGRTVKLRFRLGSDGIIGTEGWKIDNIGVVGATNLPFSSLVDDVGVCNGVPKVMAGLDQTVMVGDLVQLDGSGSTDPDGDMLSYTWTQNAGPNATLSGSTTAMPQFVAPAVTSPTVLSFSLSVSDGQGSAGDSVDVIVMPDPAMGTGGSGGMGGMAGSGGMGGMSSGGMGGMGGMSSGGMGGTAGSGGMGGIGAMGGAGGVGGMGGASSSSVASSSSSSGETGGSGGNEPVDGGSCTCTTPGDAAPVRPGLFGALGVLLGLVWRRHRRSPLARLPR